jgi:glyoxylase-like metal-dependent hydrolase (beta-lactamase superfamily II)
VSTFTIGAATVTRIEETYEPNFDAVKFFADWRPEVAQQHRDWMVPDHFEPARGNLKLSVHSWLLRIGGKTVLIDGCVGNDKSRPTRPMWNKLQTRYLERFVATGATPEQVDLVMCTHLHNDHVGWNTRLVDGRWVPTFPNARYVWHRADYEKYKDADPAKEPNNRAAFDDSVRPIVEAGLADMVAGAHTIDEHLSLEPAPGHTPGTVAITLASRGQQALFCGDIVHHGIQLFHPEWNSFACLDAEGARKSRRRMLERCAGAGALLMPAHFGAPFACHVDAKGDAFPPRWVRA